MNSRRRRGALPGLAIVLVAIAVTGWLALSGRVDWLSQIAEPRIERALLAAGIEPEALDIGRLSVGGGRVDEARLRFNGGTATIRGLEVALGLGNIWASRAGAVSIERVDLEFGEPSGDGGGDFPAWGELPVGTVEVREWHLALPIAGDTVRASGTLRATPGDAGVVAFEGDFSADLARGRFAGSYDPATQKLSLRVEDGSAVPALLALILRATMPDDPADGRVTFDWERADVNGGFEIRPQVPLDMKVDAQLTGGMVARGAVGGRFQAATLGLATTGGAPLAFEFEAAGATIDLGDVRVAAGVLQFYGAVSGGSVSVGKATITAGERETRGNLLGSFAVGEGAAGLSAEGTWIMESAAFNGITAGAAEIALELKDGALTASTEDLSVSGRVAGEIDELELAITNLTGAGDPGVNGRVVAAIDTAGLLPEGTEFEPARERVSATFLGLLGEGRESLRVEFSLEDRVRSVEHPDASVIAGGPLTGLVTLDSNHLSGSLAGGLKNVTVSNGTFGTVVFPEANLKWSTGRVWLEAVLGWPSLDPVRALRELLWVSNIDLRGTGGSFKSSEYGAAEGVALTLVSNGTDLSESAGGSIVVSAERVSAAEREFSDVGVVVGLGLEGGSYSADLSLADPRIPMHSRGTVAWRDAVALSGTYETERVDLASLGSLGKLAPALDGIAASGFATVSGPLALGPNGLEAGARVSLDAAGLAWPARGLDASGISGVVALDSVSPLHAEAGQRLEIGNAKIGDLELSEGRLEFGIPSADRMAVARLEAVTLGGRVSAAPFEFSLVDPRPGTSIRLDGLRLEQVMRFFPDVPATAEGGVVGEVPVAWNGEQVVFGTGSIGLQPGELGRVNFDYDIRMLSEGHENQRMFYPVLRRVEKAIRDLHFDRLHIDLYPTFNPGQSMQIRIGGVTTAPDVHAPVELTINVNAPLDRFVKWGTNPVKP